MRVAGATHEDVHGGETPLGPCVDRDMTLRQHDHARHAAIGREVVEMAVQDRRTGLQRSFTQRRIDVIRVRQIFCVSKIDEKMSPGEPFTVLLNKVILPILTITARN